MHKVKLFDCGTVKKLEQEINNFLETLGSESIYELIDIKFDSYQYGEGATDYHSAMVIYKL